MKPLPAIIAALAISAFAFPASSETAGAAPDKAEISQSAAAPEARPPDEEGALPSPEEQLYFAREEMLVTGPAKRPVRADEAPANVTVITHEDIVQSGVQNLGEIFRRVPGMDVVQISQSETEVSARGFAGSPLDGGRLSIMIDGRTFYLEFLGDAIWSQFPVPLSDIKRIEVIKGPMSSLYGNRALLGIINIVTYKPDETRTLIGAGGGQFKYAEGDFINAGAFSDSKRAWYKISGVYARADDLDGYSGTGHHKDREDLSGLGELSFGPFE